MQIDIIKIDLIDLRELKGEIGMAFHVEYLRNHKYWNNMRIDLDYLSFFYVSQALTKNMRYSFKDVEDFLITSYSGKKSQQRVLKSIIKRYIFRQYLKQDQRVDVDLSLVMNYSMN